MNKYRFILLIFITALFCNGSCERRENQYFITIQNNSDKEIIYQGSLYSSIALDTMCFKPMSNMEYQELIYRCLIKPYSSRKIEIDMIFNTLQTNPNIMWSLGVFNRIDIDTMSCEEFERAFPLKKEWVVTLADMEANDWTLVYTPED
ncbi:MAG: hypothetical protein BGP01_06965 [Paludibacter sp. 47-17]|nr:MAG: hypothetical protein BGP01_06965 [Paludibacter sp. 47-17]